MRPMLDPARDLAGATPEKLAKALFRRVEPLRVNERLKLTRFWHLKVTRL